MLLLPAGCAHAPSGGMAFGVLGDTPYSESEIHRLEGLIDDINREQLEFVVHLGDIGSSRNACSDAWLEARKQQFARIRHKLVVIPGDNEWVDCKDQQGRLQAWRRLFCNPPLHVEVQEGDYCEHMRWEASGFLFISLNVQGSNNNVRNAPEHARRMKVVLAWLDEAALLAEKRNASLVVLMQANPFIMLPRDGYAALRERLRQLGERMPGKVFLVHGDTHTYHDDEPLPGLRRLEVWGSPIVSWVRGAIASGELRFNAPRYR